MARRRKTTLSHRMEYCAARVFQALICASPAAFSRETGAFLGGFAFSPLHIRRDVTMDHLRGALGEELNEEELVRIARESYRNFGRMTFEFARFPRLTPRRVKEMVSLTGAEHLDRALGKGKGAILVAGHLGNWEYMATLPMMGYPMTFLVGEQHNILVDGLMNMMRARFGGEIVPVTGSLRGIFRAVRDNRVVMMLSDQDAGRRGTFVEFFGRQASTPYGSGRLAAATGAALLPGTVVGRGGGHHEIVISPAVEPPLDGNDSDEAARYYTQAYTREFEAFIRSDPDQYFWMHRRWKTRPPGE